MICKNDIFIYPSLSIMRIVGYARNESEHDTAIDPPGSANFFFSQIVPFTTIETDEYQYVLWADCDVDLGGHGFDILVRSEDVDYLSARAIEGGYQSDEDAAEITEPTIFGDGGGPVAICQHPDGWFIVR